MRTSMVDAVVLSGKIAGAVVLQQRLEALAENLKRDKSDIRQMMKDLGLKRHASTAGAEALLIEREMLDWDVGKLDALLSEEDFEELCPRRPNGEALRARLNALAALPAVEKKLRACAKASIRLDLELRAAPAPAAGGKTK